MAERFCSSAIGQTTFVTNCDKVESTENGQSSAKRTVEFMSIRKHNQKRCILANVTKICNVCQSEMKSELKYMQCP